MPVIKFVKFLLFVGIIQIVFITTVRADHSWVLDGKGGSMRVLNEEHPSVSMVREWVRMDIYENHYIVKVQFEFRNDGPPVTVKMGFPEINDTDENEKTNPVKRPGFLWFKNWVDGREVRVTRVKEKGSPLEINFGIGVYLWITEVRFRRGQTRIVRVEYRARSGDELEGWKIAAYDFTGENWHQNVKEAHFLAIMHVSGAYRLMIEAPSCLKISKNRMSGRWTDWPAYAGLMINYAPTLPEAVYLSDGSTVEKNTRTCGQYYLMLPGVQKKAVVLPDAVLIKDILFVDFRNLYGLLPRDKCTYEETKNHVALKCADRSIAFSDGVTDMELDGQKNHLPQAPFKMEGHNFDKFYIPAIVSVESLGGKIRFDSKARRVWISLKDSLGSHSN